MMRRILGRDVRYRADERISRARSRSFYDFLVDHGGFFFLLPLVRSRDASFARIFFFVGMRLRGDAGLRARKEERPRARARAQRPLAVWRKWRKISVRDTALSHAAAAL